MKTKLFAMMTALLLATTMFAQEPVEDRGQREQRDPRDKTTAIKERTQKMADEYGLTDEQTEKLFELNTKYADKIPMMGRPYRKGPRPGGERPGAQPRSREDMQARHAQMKENMEAYTAELEKIFTPEQMTKYRENWQKRMNERQQRRRRN